MPATEVEFDDGDESFGGVVDGRNVEEHLGVTHEAAQMVYQYVREHRGNCIVLRLRHTYFVMRSNIERGSRMKVGSTTRLKSAPGRSCEMMCVRTGKAASVITPKNETVG